MDMACHDVNDNETCNQAFSCRQIQDKDKPAKSMLRPYILAQACDLHEK